MFIRNNFLLTVVALATLFAFTKGLTVWQKKPTTPPVSPPDRSEAFGKYWFNGEAEITSFALSQARYGELHNGEAVLVFVTEDFRTDTHVKYESGQKVPNVPVLKLNELRKFSTGVYDYSTMTSTFSPLNTKLFPHALKASSSVQEWCGQAYLQVNQLGAGYEATGKSYFEAEVTEKYMFDRAWLTDELFTRLRIQPESLPTGDFSCVPSLLTSRFHHEKLAPEKAEATWFGGADEAFDGMDSLRTYQVSFSQSKRVLRIISEVVFPFRIVGWEEEISTPEGKKITTRATAKRTIRSAYWKQNKPEFQILRDSLGLK